MNSPMRYIKQIVYFVFLAGFVLRAPIDRKSTRLNSSHRCISYAVFCLKKQKPQQRELTAQQTGVEGMQLRRSDPAAREVGSLARARGPRGAGPPGRLSPRLFF